MFDDCLNQIEKSLQFSRFLTRSVSSRNERTSSSMEAKDGDKLRLRNDKLFGLARTSSTVLVVECIELLTKFVDAIVSEVNLALKLLVMASVESLLVVVVLVLLLLSITIDCCIFTELLTMQLVLVALVVTIFELELLIFNSSPNSLEVLSATELVVPPLPAALIISYGLEIKEKLLPVAMPDIHNSVHIFHLLLDA
uniref:Uncharacterized protein n=1 Tax=Glossina palpalis gambiensis TaxID=67801 RepID=A0A1B0BK84_9MUSC